MRMAEEEHDSEVDRRREAVEAAQVNEWRESVLWRGAGDHPVQGDSFLRGRMGAGPLTRARRVPGEWYVMPRHVARYFMRRRHHRRRIPAASRYISGCTVNPSSPAVRQLHRGRSSEFRERSSSSARLLSPSLVLPRDACMCTCVRACLCPIVYHRSFSLPLWHEYGYLFPPEYPITLSRAPFDAPYHRRWFDIYFSFLNSLCHPWSLLFSDFGNYRVR